MAGLVPSSISPPYTLQDKFSTNSKSSSSLLSAKRRSVVCSSSKKGKPGFFDVILDYIEGGPKLRKWYGAPDLNTEDGSVSVESDESSEEDEVRDAVLVTDGDNEIGQTVILSLIIKRIRVKALVKDKRAAMESFGTYVEEGFLSKVDSLKGVQHVVILSQLSVYRGSSGVQAIMNSNARKLAEQDESALVALGIPYTIIRTGLLTNDRGGKPGFSFKEGCTVDGSLSKEDAAFICIEALDAVPERGFVFEVVNGVEQVADWKDQFARLMEEA